MNLPNWAALRKVGLRINGDVERNFEACLDRDFSGVTFPLDLGGASVDTATAVRYLSQPTGVDKAYVVAWIEVAHLSNRHVASLLDWFNDLDRPVWVVPDTIGSEGPETLDGLPFIEIIAELSLDPQRDGRMLSQIASEWVEPNSPDVYFVIPDVALLHPLRGGVEVVAAVRGDGAAG